MVDDEPPVLPRRVIEEDEWATSRLAAVRATCDTPLISTGDEATVPRFVLPGFAAGPLVATDFGPRIALPGEGTWAESTPELLQNLLDGLKGLS